MIGYLLAHAERANDRQGLMACYRRSFAELRFVLVETKGSVGIPSGTLIHQRYREW